MNPAARFRQFKAPGSVAAAFLADRESMIRAIMGPFGSGKTVTCMFDSLKNASQMPICRDGIIHYKITVIGVTYGQIERNLHRTWIEWLPKDGGEWMDAEWTGGGGRYATHKISLATVRRRPSNGALIEVPVEFEAVFAAIGELSVEDFMRGFETTAFWLFEMDLLPEDVLTTAIGRTGRFPSVAMLAPETPLRGFPGCTLGSLPPGYALERKEGFKELPPGTLYRDYIIGDLNAPDIDSWFHRRFEEEPVPGQRLFKQPGGRDPRAENLMNLKPGYYEQQVQLNANKKRWIRRCIDNKYGPSEDGEVVFDEFDEERHMAPQPLRPLKGVPIKIGFDNNLRMPAAIFGQWAPSGQWRILGEIVPGRCGARKLARLVRQWLAERAPGHPVDDTAFCDPSGTYGADKEEGELAWNEELEFELRRKDPEHPQLPEVHVAIEPAPSNELNLRLDAVRDELTHFIDAATPGIIICQTAKVLRKGFVGSYIYKKPHPGSPEPAKPLKNKFSAPQDALQYLLLGAKGRYGAIENVRKPAEAAAAAAAKSTQLKTDFDVMSV